MIQFGVKAGPAIQFAESRLASVDPIQIMNPFLDASVGRKLEQVPIEAAVVIPFIALAELASHEQELLAGHAEHVAKQQT